jgi:integrase
MAKAWVKTKVFNDKTTGKPVTFYCVEFRDHTGKRRQKSYGPGPKAHRLAKQEALARDAELRTGKFEERAIAKERQAAEDAKRMTWDRFVDEYDRKEIRLMPSDRSGPLVRKSLQLFGQICENPMLHTITADTISVFREKRAEARGKKPGSKISRATVNRDLRHIKAALRAAEEWGHIAKAPKVKFLDELHELPRYVTPEHFAAIYAACNVATLPDEMHVQPVEWWRGLLMFAQMTGWRISEILALKWSDVDLAAGTAKTRAADNKGKRDAIAALHAVVLDHLRPLKTFHPNVFPWEHDRKLLTKHFHEIQTAAGIDLPCRVTSKTGAELLPEFAARAVQRWDRLTRDDLASAKGRAKRLMSPLRNRYGLKRAEAKAQTDAFAAELVASCDGHCCTPSCHKYGFHDERRSFATMNAANMTRESLQALMRHQSSLTTERYINFARQMKPAVANLHVPKVG